MTALVGSPHFNRTCVNKSSTQKLVQEHERSLHNTLQQPPHLQHEVLRRRSVPDEPQDKATGKNQRGVLEVLPLSSEGPAAYQYSG